MGKKTLGRVRKTDRGFHFIEFQDYYGAACSLQESSIALYQQPGASAIWLGCDKNTEIHKPTGTYPSPRMHLTDKQVRQLIAALTLWLETGCLSSRPKARKE